MRTKISCFLYSNWLQPQYSDCSGHSHLSIVTTTLPVVQLLDHLSVIRPKNAGTMATIV